MTRKRSRNGGRGGEQTEEDEGAFKQEISRKNEKEISYAFCSFAVVCWRCIIVL